MLNLQRSFMPMLVAGGLMAVPGVLLAVPVITGVHSSTELAYAADVSDSDLLHGLTATANGWNLTNGASPANLNDGAHGSAFSSAGVSSVGTIAWTTVGATAEFHLGVGTQGAGYDLNSIQSIADWNSASFGNQSYQIEVKPVGGTYVSLATIDYQALSGGGTTKVTLTNLGAQGIEFIKFTALQVNGGANGGAFTFREIDVFGVEAGPDGTPPTLSQLEPADGGTQASIDADLRMTFSEGVALGTGHVKVRNLDTGSELLIALNDVNQLQLSGAVLTISPTDSLSPFTRYAVQMDSTAITDLSGNAFAGISDDTTWNFTSSSAAPLRIMCLGDSITAGYTDNPVWNVPFEFGYRSGLYTRLTNAGYHFQMVGGSPEPYNNAYGDPSYGGTVSPVLDLRIYGQDAHRGYGGQAASFLNTHIVNWLAQDDPDVVLLKIGTNSQDQSGLNTLVNTIVTQQPSAQVLVAQIMPKFNYQAGIVNYNSYIRDTLVPFYQGQGKKVSLVDQYAPFLTDSSDLTTIDQSLFSNGINHPDNDGYDKMAQVWFEGIEALDLKPDLFESWIEDASYGISASEQGLADDPDGDGLPNGVEAWFGTHPGEASQGISLLSSDGQSFYFSHPVHADIPADLSPYYEHSPNLIDWYQNGSGPVGGGVISFSSSEAAGLMTIEAQASEEIEKLFIRAGVRQN